jgi:hypothetical protein
VDASCIWSVSWVSDVDGWSVVVWWSVGIGGRVVRDGIRSGDGD